MSDQKRPMSGLAIALMVIGGLAVLGFGSCVVCVGAGAAAAKHATDSTPIPGAAAQKAPTAATPVDLKALLAEYKDNEVRADSEFKGKTIRVTGKVSDIKKDILDHMYVTVGTGKDFEIPEVQCTLNAANQGAASVLSKGQLATVQGEVRGLMMNVQLEDCDLVNSP